MRSSRSSRGRGATLLSGTHGSLLLLYVSSSCSSSCSSSRLGRCSNSRLGSICPLGLGLAQRHPSSFVLDCAEKEIENSITRRHKHNTQTHRQTEIQTDRDTDRQRYKCPHTAAIVLTSSLRLFQFSLLLQISQLHTANPSTPHIIKTCHNTIQFSLIHTNIVSQVSYVVLFIGAVALALESDMAITVFLAESPPPSTEAVREVCARPPRSPCSNDPETCEEDRLEMLLAGMRCVFLSESFSCCNLSASACSSRATKLGPWPV
jgi:hypothetical protein